MSGEYYSTGAPVTTIYQGHSNIPPIKATEKKIESPKGSHRLQDIEQQLEMAESRCNTLKDQLDYMKQIYGVNKTPKTRKISNAEGDNKASDDIISLSSLSTSSGENKTFPKRQNSNAIGTDNTGAAVRTINNILNGITNSVNRLSELHVQISETPRTRRILSATTSPKEHKKSLINKASITTDHKPEDQQTSNTESDSKVSKKSRAIKRKPKEAKVMSKQKPTTSQSIKRSKLSDQLVKISNTRSSLVQKASSNLQRRLIANRSRTNSQTVKLVELYHNIAAKQSNSDELHLSKNGKKLYGSSHQPETKVETQEVPPLQIPEKADGFVRLPMADNETKKSRMEIVGNDYYEPLEAPRSMHCYTKNYELPTIASKMKQVAKCYLNTFNFKAIPFCAAISTTPSHNIGINIQQVMNIIKNRQPVNGISPTLAHNIGLAAEKLNSRPLSALVSTITSKTCYRQSQCPLSKSMINYQQLQDMAKSIPEETAEDMEEVEDSPEMKTIVITGPSGDMEVKNRNLPVWAVDPSKSEQCTCLNQSGTDLQHVANKYATKKCFTPISSNTANLQKDKRWQKLSKHESKKCSSKILQSKGVSSYLVSKYQSTPAESNEEKKEEETPLQGKERNLKDVLTNLHNDFEALNKRYEDLSHEANTDDEATLKELEVLEHELNKKEEEITMVMTLYKEVLALKQQVKTLRQKTSQASVVGQDSKDLSTNFKEYNNPEAAFHLTKLLKQIHIYQNKFKKDGCRV